MNWAVTFCLIYHNHLTSHQLTTTSLSIWTTLQGKHFYNQQEPENAFQELLNPKIQIFMLQELKKKKKNLFLIDKYVLIIMVPTLI